MDSGGSRRWCLKGIRRHHWGGWWNRGVRGDILTPSWRDWSNYTSLGPCVRTHGRSLLPFRFNIFGVAAMVGRMIAFAVAALERDLRRFVIASVHFCTAPTAPGEMAVYTAVPKPLAAETLREAWAGAKTPDRYPKVQKMVYLIYFFEESYFSELHEE